DRHADVGGKPARARAQRQRRPVGVVARLPQSVALLRYARPDEWTAAEFGGDLAEGLGLFGNAGVAAVELEEEAWPFRIAEVGIVVQRAHLQRVDEFYARDRDAHL